MFDLRAGPLVPEGGPQVGVGDGHLVAGEERAAVGQTFVENGVSSMTLFKETRCRRFSSFCGDAGGERLEGLRRSPIHY
jgi:hypothetical protein